LIDCSEIIGATKPDDSVIENDVDCISIKHACLTRLAK